jgi:mannose/fructose-specific phosphotransferase system component IIA
MFGGTPANLAVTFVSENVEVITGVNLPMLIKLARPQKAADLLTVAREMREHGRNAIWVASDLLRGEKSEKSEKGSKGEKTKTGSTGASGKDDA